jgi:hypothetical protein
MANDSQRDKARAIFGKTFFENSKALPNPKNAAAALQKRANARPIPTYKVGGAVKKNTPPQPTAADREADRKRREEYAKMKVTKQQGETIARGNRVADIEGGRYKDGGKADQDFTGLMKKAANRAAAKGTPVMKQGGATDAYTAKRVMSRIKAGNFKDGGRAESMRDRRMKDIEKDYKIALAKGKNEGVAKAKYEQRKADAADDYAKRTKGDRTETRAAERAAEANLTKTRKYGAPKAVTTEAPAAKVMDSLPALTAPKMDSSIGAKPKVSKTVQKPVKAADKPVKAADKPVKAEDKPKDRYYVSPENRKAIDKAAKQYPISKLGNVIIPRRSDAPLGDALLAVNRRLRGSAGKTDKPKPTVTAFGGTALRGQAPKAEAPKPKAEATKPKTKPLNAAQRSALALADLNQKAGSNYTRQAPTFDVTRNPKQEGKKRDATYLSAIEGYAAGGAGKVRKGMMKGK